MIADGRIEKRFAKLKEEGRGGLVTFTTAGDPDLETSWEILKGLPAAGADLIELGMPFSDPMADGPAIQAAGLRALNAGMTLEKTLGLAKRFREEVDQETPLILMGYYNPIYSMGVDTFLQAAGEAGIDGLIIVDLPPEEDSELCQPAIEAGLRWIRLTTPTTDEKRLPAVLDKAGGFLYYVSILGITGTRSASLEEVEGHVSRIRAASGLPIAVGFGVKTPEQARGMSQVGDAAVVGSAIVEKVRENLDAQDRPNPQTAEKVLSFVASLGDGVRGKV